MESAIKTTPSMTAGNLQSRQCERSEVERVRRFVAYAKLRLNNAAYYPPYGGHRYMVALALYSKCITVAEAALTLLDAGFGDEAFGMTRTLIDIFFTLRYIANQDTDARAKLYYEFVSKDVEGFWSAQRLVRLRQHSLHQHQRRPGGLFLGRWCVLHFLADIFKQFYFLQQHDQQPEQLWLLHVFSLDSGDHEQRADREQSLVQLPAEQFAGTEYRGDVGLQRLLWNVLQRMPEQLYVRQRHIRAQIRSGFGPIRERGPDHKRKQLQFDWEHHGWHVLI